MAMLRLNVLTENEMLQKGLEILGYDQQAQTRVHWKTRVRRFKRHFASSPLVCSILWETLQTTDIDDARITNTSDKAFTMFLMALYYLKCYPVEEVIASRFHVHEQTARKWIHFYIKKLAALLHLKVQWPENDEWDTTFIISIDCVNFGTNEPRHPTLHKDKETFDRKNGKARLTYEIALHLWQNRIVWFNGPFKAAKGDQKI